MLKILIGTKISNPKRHKKYNWKQVIVYFVSLNSYSLQTNTIQKLEEEKAQNLEN